MRWAARKGNTNSKLITFEKQDLIMAESALGILFEMIFLLLSNVISTLLGLLELFIQFVGSMDPVVSSGPGGILLGVIVVGLVVFALAKFVFSSGKSIMILIILGILLILFLVVGNSVF